MEEEELIEIAKEEFQKYVGKEQEKMNINDFEKFINKFFEDQPSVLKSIKIPELFNEFSKEEKGKIDEREFRQAYKELKISRMDTNDQIKFENLKK